MSGVDVCSTRRKDAPASSYQVSRSESSDPGSPRGLLMLRGDIGSGCSGNTGPISVSPKYTGCRGSSPNLSHIKDHFHSAPITPSQAGSIALLVHTHSPGMSALLCMRSAIMLPPVGSTKVINGVGSVSAYGSATDWASPAGVPQRPASGWRVGSCGLNAGSTSGLTWRR